MKAAITLAENGTERLIYAETGEKLSDVFHRYGVRIDMPCAGMGICKGCSVVVNGEKRLACQTKVDSGMRIRLDAPAEFENIMAGDIISGSLGVPMYSRYGLSVDIGTTTVCVSLLDADGRISAATRKNPQTSFGADVISRIEKALSGGSAELARCIRITLGEMTEDLCAGRGIAPESVEAAVITGNTAMLYLLMEQNPEPLSRAPFRADRLFGEYVSAKTLGIPISPNARIYLPRCVSAFVGGDITTAIIASGMCGHEGTAMLVDIGTNGEIALWHDGELSCCSTAAGPAFEGAGISCGVYGINGAIDHVRHVDGQIRCSTISGTQAAGICGSGIVDALAVMLELGAIDETGAITDESGYIELQNGIGITARDVRKIQLAKGSVRAGIETLLEVSGIDKSEVETLYIAGAFGSFINLENAAAIGLIPREMLNQTKVIGNAAHTGATILLQNRSLADVSNKLADRAHTVSLDANPVFTDNYMTYMTFE